MMDQYLYIEAPNGTAGQRRLLLNLTRTQNILLATAPLAIAPLFLTETGLTISFPTFDLMTFCIIKVKSGYGDDEVRSSYEKIKKLIQTQRNDRVIKVYLDEHVDLLTGNAGG